LRDGLNGEQLGAVSTPTCETLTRSSRTHSALLALSVSLLAFAAFLVSPALALADSTNGNGNANASTTSTTSDPAATTTSSDAPTTTTSAPATSPTPSAPVTPDASSQTNTSSADTAGAQGDGSGNGNGNAAAPAVTPTPDAAPPVTTAANAQNNGNSANSPNGNASGQNTSPGNSANALGQSDPAGNSDHTGNANASANASQDKPKNVNVDVRVGNPGDNGAVVQGNGSTAAAAAGSSGGSGSGSGSAPTALAPGGASADAAATPGSAAPAASQADSTSGETIPVANSPPGGTAASDPGLTGAPANVTPAPNGDSSPTVLNTSPSASYVNGASPVSQTTTGGTGNASSQPQATGVTGGTGPGGTVNGDQATPVTPDYTTSNGEIVIHLPGPEDDGADASTPADGSTGVTVVPDDGTDDTAGSVPDVTITAPAPSGSTSVDSANAGANSTQLDPTNINASIRILSPGDNDQVSQSNNASAVAAAGAQGAEATALPQATATQADPHNINVSIRVGSPGNDAAVTQQNTATATATAVDPAAIEPATADLPNDPNSAADVQNVSSIIQNLGQCPEESTCLASSTSAPDASAAGSVASDQSTATATQQAPSNVSVSVRVASPGIDGIVNQLNDASAHGATTVTTTSDPENVVVGVVIPGNPADVVIPTDSTTPWNWTWNWTTGTAPVSPDATPFSSPDWNWNWGSPADATATATTPATATAPTPGQWTWTWIWTRGDGWTTTWTYSQPCSCTWNWVWTWNWPADQQPNQPNTAPADIPAPPSNPQVEQTNNTSAAAAALTTFTRRQTVTSTTDGDSGPATEYQGITSDQSATATADAAQTRPFNLSVVTAGRTHKIRQENDAVAAASAAAFDQATQSITQRQSGTHDGAVHAVDGTQVIATAQNATANAQSLQADAANVVQVWSLMGGNQATIGLITQKNRAVTVTYAVVSSETTQTIHQTQTGGGAEQLATALQAAIVTQAQHAAVQVGQASVRNRATIEIPWNGLWNPPITQSNDVSAAAISTAVSGILQTVVQEESGDGVAWDEHAIQTAIVIQSGSASGSAGQSVRENVAGWNGTVVSDAPGDIRSIPGSGAPGAEVIADEGLIVSTPPLPTSDVLVGDVSIFSAASARAVPKTIGWQALPAVTATNGSMVPAASSAHSASTTVAANQYRHVLLNLLSAMSSALGVLLGTTPFAALLALFMIAALGVGRLQYTVPALGRSADFARRERPG